MSLEEELKAENRASYQDLVGDVRLLRFLRGHKMNVSVAATRYREMLELRKQLNLDEIRNAILEKNLSPDEFPHFQKIMYVIGGLSGMLIILPGGNERGLTRIAVRTCRCCRHTTSGASTTTSSSTSK